MAETHRLAPGTRWENPWTGQRCVVVDAGPEAVTARLLPGGELRRYPCLEAFLGAHVLARAARPDTRLNPDF